MTITEVGQVSQEIEDQITANIERSMAEIAHPSQATGTNLYGSTKVFPDYQAEPGQSYFTLVHGIAHESSVSFVAILQATRAARKGFESAIYFYGPGTINAMATRGFPTVGDSGFPGEQNINNALETFIAEGNRVFVCRFGMALHGLRDAEPADEDAVAGSAWRCTACARRTSSPAPSRATRWTCRTRSSTTRPCARSG